MNPAHSFFSRLAARNATAFLAGLCLLLACACDSFERNAYRTLKVTQVEYELLQEHAARGYLAGRLTQEQWDRFAVAGNRFIAAHTLAADLMKTWQEAQRAGDLSDEASSALERRVGAALAQLPALLADLRSLLASFDRPAAPAPKRR